LKERLVFCWSGGKDSALALHKVQNDSRYEVVSLLTICNEHFQHVSIPAIDRRSAIEAIDIRLLSEDTHPSLRSRFWHNGSWISSPHEADEFESLHLKRGTPCAIPEGLEASLAGRVGKIYPCSVESHAFIDVGNLPADAVEDLLDALRGALPKGTMLGLTERRNLIHIELPGPHG
jgi:hypothetical protein